MTIDRDTLPEWLMDKTFTFNDWCSDQRLNKFINKVIDKESPYDQALFLTICYPNSVFATAPKKIVEECLDFIAYCYEEDDKEQLRLDTIEYIQQKVTQYHRNRERIIKQYNKLNRAPIKTDEDYLEKLDSLYHHMLYTDGFYKKQYNYYQWLRNMLERGTHD